MKELLKVQPSGPVEMCIALRNYVQDRALTYYRTEFANENSLTVSKLPLPKNDAAIAALWKLRKEKEIPEENISVAKALTLTNKVDGKTDVVVVK